LPIKPPTSIERLQLLIVNLVATSAISMLLKRIIDIPRPCQLEPNLYATCLPDYAYPSIHAGTAFSFVFSFLGHAFFPLAYVIGLLVSWSRVYQGLHSWFDIGGGIAVAGLGYSIAEAIVVKQKNIIYRDDERSRQAIHVSMGLMLCSMIWFLGIETTLYFVLFGTCIGILIIHLTLIGINLPGIDKLLDRFERKGVMPGEGSMYYALGVLFALGLLRNNPAQAISVILILGLGDGLATYFGKCHGNHKLPWNRNKTVEGLVGFGVGSASALLVLPVPATIFVVVSATIVESLPIKLDDNITLPVVTSLLYYLILGL
jgi:dolichol kinase